MSKDEKLLQRVFDLFSPLVRGGWTVDAADRTTFFFGGGFDMLRICSSDPDDRKPVVMFKLNRNTLDRKELSFNVI